MKKLLVTVPYRLYATVAGIEQFCDIEGMAFDEALECLKAFEERTRRRTQGDDERVDGQLMLMEAQWAARRRQRDGGSDDDGTSSTASGNWKKRRGRCYNCGQHGQFKWGCTKPRKAPAAEYVLLADIGDNLGPTLL